jgi:hypothetical protein
LNPTLSLPVFSLKIKLITSAHSYPGCSIQFKE